MKRYSAISMFLAALMLTGCASREITETDAPGYGSEIAIGEGDAAPEKQGSSPAYGSDTAIEEGDAAPDEQDGPPALRLELVDEMTASVVTLDRSTFTWDDLCVDCISPLESYEEGFVRAVIRTDGLVKPPKLLLTDGAEIIEVVCHGDGFQNVEFTEDGELMLPEDPVGVVYEVRVRYEQGSCCYLFATAAAADEAENGGQNTSSYDPSAANLSSPPALSIQTETAEQTQTQTLTSGNYSWTVVRGEEASETIACGASPLQSAANGSAVTIPAADKLLAAPRLILTNGAEISDVKVWRSEDDPNSVEFTEDGDILLADSSEGIVYSVTVTFPQGEAEYVFAVEELCGYPLAGEMDGLWLPDSKLSRTDDFDGWEGLITVTAPDVRFPQYDAEFFAENVLLVLTMTESSGSVSHEFLGIDSDNAIHIRRTLPMVGTCDMAKHQLVIELPISCADEQFTVIYDDVMQ